MKKILLANNTLISKMDWCRQAPNSKHRDQPSKTWSQVAYEELEGALNREKFEPNEARTRGLEFEDFVYKMAYQPESRIETYSKEFKEVVTSLRGYDFQKYMQKDIDFTFDDVDYTLRFYGYFDAYKKGKIIDLKTTKKYKPNHYLNSLQHLIYCFVSGELNFEYIIAEWGEYPAIKSVNREVFSIVEEELIDVEIKLIAKVKEFMQFLKDLKMLDIYINVYCNKN